MLKDKAHFLFVIMIAGLVVIGVGWKSSFAQSKELTKIGVIANMGWPVGKSAAQAIQLAVKHINDEGGLIGRPLKLLEADSKGQVPDAVAEYRKLVITEHVSLIVVAEGGTSTLAC